ncbi:MAG: tRNA (guanosine(37)-N1)-methyltransferase TrmD [Clostridiales bacterium]|nr:tRNA (guanosine(37)-N1)-methyltransferase TrmD [Clostridiales bacterium]
MKIKILTLFPEMFAPLEQSIIGRARKNGLIEIEYLNIRDFTTDKHKRVDDYPFGGGAGMVMQAQPVVDCIRAAMQDFPAKKIHMSPRGKPFTQAEAQRLSKEENLIILCSHYEGVDQRALDMCIDEEISMGDYVLTGGELPAMCLVDSISRLVPGVLGSSESFVDESFSDPNLLEYPQYTRPAEFEGIKVPDVLLSGHAANIAKWRREQALLVTRQRRPDLIKDEK